MKNTFPQILIPAPSLAPLNRRNLFGVLLSIFSLLPFGLMAQDFPCTYWPAPCPKTSSLEQADDGPQRKQNGAIEQTLAFSIQMRNRLTDFMQYEAKKNRWHVYELMEDYNDGAPFIFISFDAWRQTPYQRRPPVSDDITFILIVNRDSLNEWRDWSVRQRKESAEQVNAYANQSKSIDDDPLLKRYFDSSMYYTQERLNYSQAHEKQHLEDARNNNQKALEEYEKAMKRYTARSDAFIKKYQDRQTALYAGAGSSLNAYEDNVATTTASFTEGSIVLLHFALNPYLVTSGMEDDEQRSLQGQHLLEIPGASYAALLLNHKKPDSHAYEFNYKGYLFNSPAAIATVLFGRYQPRDAYNNFRPQFEKGYNTAAATLGQEKAVKCDVLQNMALHIEGGPSNVMNVVNRLDWNTIAGMTGK